MTNEDIKRKNLILIKYLQSLNFNKNFKFKAEYSTNDNDKRVVVVQEQTGAKIVFYGDCPPLYNYYSIEIFGESIQEAKELSVDIGNLIGQSIRLSNEIKIGDKKYDELWQIIFKQFTNFQPIEYMDIRRVGYTGTLQCIVNLVSRVEIQENENQE